MQDAARYLVGTILMSVGPITGVGSALPVGAAVHDPPPAAHAEYDAFWSPAGAPRPGSGTCSTVEDPSWEAGRRRRPRPRSPR